jgi:hypothetical protein
LQELASQDRAKKELAARLIGWERGADGVKGVSSDQRSEWREFVGNCYVPDDRLSSDNKLLRSPST